MNSLKLYLEKTAAAQVSDSIREGVVTGVGSGIGAGIGALTGPDLMDIVKPGMLSPNKARIITALIGAGGAGLGYNQLAKAETAALNKDKAEGLTKQPIKATDRLSRQITGGGLGAVVGALGGGTGATALINKFKPKMLPHNVNRAQLVASLLGAGGLGALSGHASGKAVDVYNQSLKK